MLQRQLFNQYQRRKRRLAVPTMVADVYVDIAATGANDGTSWVNAYTNLQVAVTNSLVDDLIAVNDGVYAPIVIDNKRITIESVNGAAVTIIDGGGTDRCATLGTVEAHTNTVLNGFTLTNGFATVSGGGSAFGTLNNCTLSGNTASNQGGGSYSGTLNNCTLSGNTASNQGGGSYGGTLNNCTLTANTADRGGGSYGGTLNNCTLTANTADRGGGSFNSTLNNCTIKNNHALTNGAGVYNGTLYSCLLYGNTSPNNNDQIRNQDVIFNAYNCTAIGYVSFANNTGDLFNNIFYYSHIVLGSGTYGNNCFSGTYAGNNDVGNNISIDPLFVDATNGDFRLQPSSLCIDAGSNDYVTTATDLDGNPRIVNDTVDMGAYEYQGE